MFGLGGWELILVVVAVVLIFGAKKLPQLGKGIGEGIREFRKTSRDDRDIQKDA